MIEGFKQSQPERPSTPLETWSYFESTATSKEFIAAKRFAEKYIATGKYAEDLAGTPENKEVLKKYIESLGNRLGPGINAEEVIAELERAGAVTEVSAEKVKKEKSVEFIKTNYVQLEKPKIVELDEAELKLLEANLLSEELKKENIFKNTDELASVYNRALEIQQGRIESFEYYNDFFEAGLIKGGATEVATDLQSLADRKKDFELKEDITPDQKEKLENAKMIATIAESALAYGVTEHEWYGEDVSVVTASEFDDVKRGVDNVLEIKKDDESNFMALALDVTFRGLYSEQFKHKLFTLLRSIQNGHKTKIKYLKNHKHEPMKEFAVPKMVLYFNVNDVKDMVEILKEKDASTREGYQKVNVLSQIIHSCTLLAEFAEKSQNNIFRRYVAVKNSLKELAWENPDIQKIIDDAHMESDVSKHLKELIAEFEMIEASKNESHEA